MLQTLHMRPFYKPATIRLGASFVLTAISLTLILPSGMIFAQQKEIIYNGKPISISLYLTLSLGDRLTVLSASGNDPSLLALYLNPLSDDDIDSLAVLAQARIDKLRDVGAELGISPEVIEKQVNAYQTVIPIIKAFRTSRPSSQQPPGRKISVAEEKFVAGDLKSKLSMLSLLMNTSLFEKYYALLSPAENSKALAELDEMISEQKKYGQAAGLTQEMVDREVTKYIVLKDKILSLKQGRSQ